MRCALDPKGAYENTNHSLFDKYEMIKDLGTGSSGSVTLVRHISMDQERALKKVPKASAFAESALSEARLLKSLEHPSIPRIFDFEEDNAFTISSRNISTARR